MKVYKVVDKYENGLQSARMTGKFALAYKPGEITKPIIGRILVFKSLEKAKDFSSPNEQIWEATAWKCKPVEVLIEDRSDNTEINIRKVFRKNSNLTFRTMSPPAGTLSCLALRLDKRIQ